MKIKQNIYLFLLSTVAKVFKNKPFTTRHYIQLQESSLHFIQDKIDTKIHLDGLEITLIEKLLSTTIVFTKNNKTLRVTQLRKEDCLRFKDSFQDKVLIVTLKKREQLLNERWAREKAEEQQQQEEIKKQRRKKELKYINDNITTISAVFDDWQKHTKAKTYLTSYVKNTFRQRLDSIRPALHSFDQFDEIDSNYKYQLNTLKNISSSLTEVINDRNKK